MAKSTQPECLAKHFSSAEIETVGQGGMFMQSGREKIFGWDADQWVEYGDGSRFAMGKTGRAEGLYEWAECGDRSRFAMGKTGRAEWLL